MGCSPPLPPPAISDPGCPLTGEGVPLSPAKLNGSDSSKSLPSPSSSPQPDWIASPTHDPQWCPSDPTDSSLSSLFGECRRLGRRRRPAGRQRAPRGTSGRDWSLTSLHCGRSPRTPILFRGASRGTYAGEMHITVLWRTWTRVTFSPAEMGASPLSLLCLSPGRPLSWLLPARAFCPCCCRQGRMRLGGFSVSSPILSVF